MSTKRPTPAQAQRAVELLRLLVATPTDTNVYAQSVELVTEIDTRKRAHKKHGPRWIEDRIGQHFRTGDNVTTASGQRLKVEAIDTQAQTCLLSDDSLHHGSSVTKVNPKDPAPEVMAGIGQMEI